MRKYPHFHQQVMALLEIALGHANMNWELYSGIKPISFGPRFWGGITPFMQNVVRSMWSCAIRAPKMDGVKKCMVGKILEIQQLMQKS
jgi:hypothetical protein